jgi:peptidoglycan/xylan/chitin deacetylase (PgdA/CDA1 family)
MKPFLYFLSGLLFPGMVWSKPSKNKHLYLTFDDGPHPVITPKVLNILDAFGAKATFFCVGENVKKHMETYQEVLKRGHICGNHTYQHLTGWKTPTDKYITDVRKCSKHVTSALFRPPHGKIKPLQLKALKKEGYTVVMWSVLTKDYQHRSNKKKLLQSAIKKTGPGSIIVFHDSEKAANHLLYILPEFLDYFTKKGYSFKTLQNDT